MNIIHTETENRFTSYSNALKALIPDDEIIQLHYAAIR